MGIPIVEVTWQLYHYISIILYSIWNLYYLANQVIIKDIWFIPTMGIPILVKKHLYIQISPRMV